MKAYVIASETVNDEATFARYRAEVPGTVEPFGGKFIVRGGDISVLEGAWPHPRLVVIEYNADVRFPLVILFKALDRRNLPIQS